MTSTLTATAVDDEAAPAVSRVDGAVGWLLARAGVLLAAWVLLGAVAVVPLSLLHLWRPAVALPVLLVALALAVRVSGGVPAPPVRRSAGLAVVLVAAACGVWAGLTHAEHVVLRRDAGSYALYGQHLASAGTTRVDVRLADLGGPTVLTMPRATVGSPAFFQQGAGADTSVVPQFLPATPAWLSLGWWMGGWTGLLLVPAVALGAALLALGGLAARLVGPGWAVVATAAVGVSQPVLHVGRSTYSEPLALLVGCAGLAVLVDATAVAGGESVSRARDALGRRLALLAGLLLGGVALVRVDGLRETALLVPVAGLLAVRRSAGGPLAVGLGVSTVVAAVSALLLSRPYLGSIAASLLPLAAGALLLGAASAAAVRLSRGGPPWVARGWLSGRWWSGQWLSGRWWSGRWWSGRWWSGRLSRPGAALAAVRSGVVPAVLAGAVLLVGVLLASRPLWQTVRQDPADPGSKMVAGLQLRQGLPIDGGRTYAEHSVAWLAWWVGVPTLVLALAGAAGLAARLGAAWQAGRLDASGGPERLGATWQTDRALPPWLGPLVVGLGSTALTLYRPGITPDHPWADRRLVPVVLPTAVLLACATLRWAVPGCTSWLAARLPAGTSERLSGGPRGGWLRAGVATVGAALVLVPTAVATLPVAGQRTERGEVGAVRRACAAFGRSDTAVLLGSRAANEWPQVVRGACGVPTLVMRPTATSPVDPTVLDRVVKGIGSAGRRPVLVTADGRDVLTRIGATPRLVVHLHAIEDARWLTRRPAGGVRLDVDLWVAPVRSSTR